MKKQSAEEIKIKIHKTIEQLKRMKKRLKEVCTHNDVEHGQFLDDDEVHVSMYTYTNYYKCKVCELYSDDWRNDEDYQALNEAYKRNKRT